MDMYRCLTIIIDVQNNWYIAVTLNRTHCRLSPFIYTGVAVVD